MTAVFLAYFVLMQSTELTFIDAKTNVSKKFLAPPSSIITSAEVKDSGSDWKIDLTLQGSFNPVSPEPQVLEIHRITNESTFDVCLLQIQGSSSLGPIKDLKRGECVLLGRSGTITKLNASIRKDGITIVLPKSSEVKNWCAITRWRPSGLSENYSPSSLWNSPVSIVFGRTAQMQEIPSLLAFLKFEFGQ
jgi:hypothetical protein